ncbi:MAG: type II toxin-antitoxin system death-on-curing family toxin [Promethearchaeota archaeon]
MTYITKEQAIEIYKSLIETTGGEYGINDDLLTLCLDIPSQIYFGHEVHLTILDKAAAYLYYFVTLHPFTDGNKRFGYVVTRIFLLVNGYDFNCSQEERYNFVMSIAQNQETLESVKLWIKKFVDKRDL